MNAQCVLQRTASLQQSYLAIYRYFHTSRPQILVKSRPCCTKRCLFCSKSSTILRRALSTSSKLPENQSTTTPDPVPKNDTPSQLYEKDDSRNFVKKTNIKASPRVWLELAKRPDFIEALSGRSAVLHGYLTTQRPSKSASFVNLADPNLRIALQLVIPSELKVTSSATDGLEPWSTDDKVLRQLKDLRPHTPVTVVGKLVAREQPKSDKENVDPNLPQTVPMYDPHVGTLQLVNRVEMQVLELHQHNSLPKELIAKADTVFGPEQRHLQLRTDADLRKRLRLRSWAMTRARKNLFIRGFDEVETPLLFKSTPEGAREFLVPTRQKGFAYALPQSPQQYKQLLMASGISCYFQFAKCFRDEDLRADRQPEFTQLDMEMAFADASQVMAVVESVIIESIWLSEGTSHYRPRQPLFPWEYNSAQQAPIPILTYQQSMCQYGSDKPDLRLEAEFRDITRIVPPSLLKMLTSLENPVVEMMKVDLSGTDPTRSGAFVSSFFNHPDNEAYVNNADGMPGITVFDSRKPLNGLASFGHKAAEQIEQIFEPEPGDILIMQSRPNRPFTGGSTMLGNLRRDIIHAAIAQELREPVDGLAMLWVRDFPLFSPLETGEAGQGGSAGICSTHHPFTAPKEGQDLSKMATDPLSIIGDHYDLVINGVEVGGGSRRIHNAAMQEFVLRDVLKMAPERIEDFRHLLNALKTGCPPHAGFALGFDRLLAVLMNVPSVRDVIAFPKNGSGEDKFVGSPVPITAEQLSTYHLKISDEVKAAPEPSISIKA